MRFAPVAFVLLSMSWVGVSAAPARACSGPLPTVYRGAVFPADGASAVAVNTRIWIFYYTELGDFPQDPILRSADGVVVECEVELRGAGEPAGRVLIVRPRAALAPATGYEILDRVGDDGAILEIHRHVGGFTTGTEPDTSAPAPAPTPDVTVGGRDICDSGDCCGPYDAIHFSLTWTASADPEIVFYELGGAIFTAPSVTGAYFCSRDWMSRGPVGVQLYGSSRQRVRVLDLAENASSPSGLSEVDVSAMCVTADAGVEPPDTDAGPSREPDAGPTSAADPAGGGCSCALGSPPRNFVGSAVAALLLLGALVAMTTTRRDRR